MSLTRKHPPTPKREATQMQRRPDMAPAQAVMARVDRDRPAVARVEVRRKTGEPRRPGRHDSEAWRRAVATLPCMLCGKEGETQCAHRNQGKGMALKTDDAMTAALCATCHQEIDQGSTLSRDERRERMDRAILLTIQRLARDGLIRA